MRLLFFYQFLVKGLIGDAGGAVRSGGGGGVAKGIASGNGERGHRGRHWGKDYRDERVSSNSTDAESFKIKEQKTIDCIKNKNFNDYSGL